VERRAALTTIPSVISADRRRTVSARGAPSSSRYPEVRGRTAGTSDAEVSARGAPSSSRYLMDRDKLYSVPDLSRLVERRAALATQAAAKPAFEFLSRLVERRAALTTVRQGCRGAVAPGSRLVERRAALATGASPLAARRRRTFAVSARGAPSSSRYGRAPRSRSRGVISTGLGSWSAEQLSLRLRAQTRRALGATVSARGAPSSSRHRRPGVLEGLDAPVQGLGS